MTAAYPERKLFLETGRPAKGGNHELTRRAIDLVAPVGYGQRALIVAPTRELALQSMDHLKNLSRYVHLKGHAIFGGVPMQPQIHALRQGLDIVSATPGRLS